MTNPQPTSYLMVDTETISPKIRNKTRVPTIPTPIQHSTGILATAIRQEEEIKEIQICKRNCQNIPIFRTNDPVS
jgi:hypothetical protein